MGSMQGPGPSQGQDSDRAMSDNDRRYDELTQKQQKGEELTQTEQQELNRLNEEGRNRGAGVGQKPHPGQGESVAQRVGASDDEKADNQPASRV